MQNGHSSPSSHRRTGEGRRFAGGGPIRARWAWAAAGNEGERGREVLWWGSRPHLGLGWCAEAGRREPAAAALQVRRGLGPAGEVVGMAGELGAPFIAELRRWSGVGG